MILRIESAERESESSIVRTRNSRQVEIRQCRSKPRMFEDPKIQRSKERF